VTIGYHAPPPGSQSGVADYAKTLREALEKLGVNTRENGAAIQLYHLGNNSLHSEIYDRSLRQPGVIVLHDAVLHHFLLGRLSREEYISEFVYNYGEWQRDLADELWEERGGSGVDARYFDHPMLRRAVEHALAVIVHNPAAARIAADHGARNVQMIPHFAAPRPLPDAASAAYFRQRHGIPQNATLFGIFGFLRETKRVLPCLRAFRRLHAARPNTALFLAGEAASSDLKRLLETEAAQPSVYRAGFLSERELDKASVAIDCCLNLRYPGAGETSGITIRMASAGTPLIITESEECAALPESSCLRVRPGVAEAEELFEHMSVVTDCPQLVRELGQQARRHIETFHSLETVARQYKHLLCTVAS